MASEQMTPWSIRRWAGVTPRGMWSGVIAPHEKQVGGRKDRDGDAGVRQLARGCSEIVGGSTDSLVTCPDRDASAIAMRRGLTADLIQFHP